MSLAQITRSLTRLAKSRFVGAADSDIRQFVLLQVNTALDHPGRTVKDEEVLKLADAAFEEAATIGEAWAVSLKNSYRDHVVKPLVDKARAAGVDPAPVVVVETGLTESDALSMIEALDANTSSDDDGDNDLDMDLLTTDDGADNALAATV